MKRSARESLEAYYQEADSWAKDREDGLRTSRRIAWIIASIAAIVALFEACALIFLTPLKTVVPYTLMVDRQTGFVQALKPVDADKIAPDAALTQSFLVQYVIARESFDIDALQANYRKTFLWSADRARSDYVAGVQVSNPESPLSLYPRSTLVETRVKSVSPLGKSASMVRFETQRRDAGGQLSAPRAWVAIITYRYSTQAMQAEDRYVNPLGFQVVRYSRNAEALPTPDAAAVPPAAAISPAAAVPDPLQPLPAQATQPKAAPPAPQAQKQGPATVELVP
jgi:type IV secretion system protein VirB8